MSYDIVSPGNQRIKWLARLRDRRHRDAEGVFVVEGERLYTRALAAGLQPSLTFTDGTIATVGDTLTVAPQVLDRVSYRSASEGLIAVFPQFGLSLDRVRPSATPLILVAEDIEKPGNLGAMMRTAAAAGVDAIVAVGGAVDPFNPNALRSSTGALFTVPLAVSNWEETGPWLAGHGIEVVGASPGSAVSLWEADLAGPVALVIGAEDTGLSEQASSIVSSIVTIPMRERGVDSLNASVAAAVLLFEAVRQRSMG